MKYILTIFIFLMMSINLCSAIDVQINMKDSFVTGEMVYFNYTISSDSSQNISYMVKTMCPNAPLPFLEQKEIAIGKTNPYYGSYDIMEIKDFISPQNCSASIEIIKPVRTITEKQFSILAKPLLTLDINLNKKVFIKGEDIKISYLSSFLEVSTDAILTYPDKTTKQITLPAEIKAEKIGAYNLEVTASKQGYKNITQNLQFAVIEKNADIKDASSCNLDSICSGDENIQNCPQDCSKSGKSYLWIWIILIILIVIILGVIIFLRKRNSEVLLEANRVS